MSGDNHIDKDLLDQLLSITSQHSSLNASTKALEDELRREMMRIGDDVKENEESLEDLKKEFVDFRQDQEQIRMFRRFMVSIGGIIGLIAVNWPEITEFISALLEFLTNA